MNSRWKVRMLGELGVQGDSGTLSRFRTQKTGSLLAYLAYHVGRTHAREELTELFWPEDDLETGRHKLSVALSWLRGQLEPPGVPDSSVLCADRTSVRLNPSQVSTDVADFEGRFASAREATSERERARLLRAAVESYGGRLLPGYYDEWVLPEQRRLESMCAEAIRSLIPLLEQDGDPAALQFAIRAVALDPLREAGHQALMRLYAAAAQPEAALRQYAELEQILRQEMGAIPTEETRRLAHEIRQGLSQASIGSGPSPTARVVLPLSLREANGGVLLSGAGAPVRDDDPVGGAVPLNSPFYIQRDADAEVERAVARRTSIVLLKGARQVGKTSLLARALQHARDQGARAVCTDLQLLNSEQLRSPDALLQAIARTISEQLGLSPEPPSLWNPEDGANMNFRRFMRKTIQSSAAPLVWALDDVDRLFTCPFGLEIFALLRAWHNERALDPHGPWSNLTLVIAYASEAHLFIRDVNQSPFNVGTRLVLHDFTLDQVRHLNRLYGRPLRDAGEVLRFHSLVGGHPYLVRRGFLEMASRSLGLAALEARADAEDWIYGDHLRRIYAGLIQDPELCDGVREVLRGRSFPSPAAFYRLRSAGLLWGDAAEQSRLRCQLYSRYLARYLIPRSPSSRE